MQAYKLYQELVHPKLPHHPANCIGDGADGDAYLLRNKPHRVIKFSVLYQHSNPDIDYLYEDIKDNLSFIRDEQPNAYARVYEHGYLGTKYRQSYLGEEKFILYYYIMEKLEELSDDEKRVFHSICSHEDANRVKDYSTEELKKVLRGLSRGLDFDAARVILFCNEIKNNKLKHLDLHSRNIMKDSSNNYKLIDFDRLKMEKTL